MIAVDVLDTLILLSAGAALPTVLAAVATLLRARRGPRADKGTVDDRLRALGDLDPEAVEALGVEVETLAAAIRNQQAAPVSGPAGQHRRRFAH